ncbi:MAG: NUDIX hydrolase [Anaerolineales bacterium]|jgi:8-oxo-dGTP pyrophosphatase MutT (NUDIX family)
MDIQTDRIRKALALVNEQENQACPPLPGIESGRKLPAGVLIPLLQEAGSWKILFIKRTLQQHDRHSGQIAFPGGRAEPGDQGLLQTALREASEEIGLAPGDIRILGRSCSITTVTDYEVSPFVGLLPWPYPLILSPQEVEKTILIPLDWLNDPNNREIKAWQSPKEPGKDLPVIFYNAYEGEILWGATARIVVDFLEIIQGDS